MVAGLAIVTTNSSGCKEVVGDCAELIFPDSIKDMKNSLVKLIKSPDYMKKLQILAAKTARENYDWINVVDRYLQFFTNRIVYDDI